MNPKDLAMLNGSIDTMRELYYFLRALPVSEARKGFQDLETDLQTLCAGKDKPDSNYVDVIAEHVIWYGILNGQDDAFPGHCSLLENVYGIQGLTITEERGKVPPDGKITSHTPLIISDPVDRSSYLEKIVAEHCMESNNLGEVFEAERKKIGESRARVEAPTSSVTLLKDNTIKYSIVLNLLTGEVIVAYEPGVFSADITTLNGVDGLITPVQFKSQKTLSMVCYNDANGKYNRNRLGTHLDLFDLDTSIQSPGGPNRFMYLVEEQGKEPVNSTGVIANNGEKMQESLPNIAVAYFSGGQLHAYKLLGDRAENKSGIPLTPNPEQSLYIHGRDQCTVHMDVLSNHANPSLLRDTTVVIPSANQPALDVMYQRVQQGRAIRII